MADLIAHWWVPSLAVLVFWGLGLGLMKSDLCDSHNGAWAGSVVFGFMALGLMALGAISTVVAIVAFIGMVVT